MKSNKIKKNLYLINMIIYFLNVALLCFKKKNYYLKDKLLSEYHLSYYFIKYIILL